MYSPFFISKLGSMPELLRSVWRLKAQMPNQEKCSTSPPSVHAELSGLLGGRRGEGPFPAEDKPRSIACNCNAMERTFGVQAAKPRLGLRRDLGPFPGVPPGPPDICTSTLLPIAYGSRALHHALDP